MADWMACIDDAGTHDESIFVAAGVAMASEETWRILCLEWADILTGYRIEDHHAKDFDNPNSPKYAHLTMSKRAECNKQLIALLRRHSERNGGDFQSFIQAIRRSEFDLALKNSGVDEQFEPFNYLLELCLWNIKDFSAHEASICDMNVVVDLSGKITSRLLQKILRDSQCAKLGKMRRIGPGTARDRIPFQVADLIAHEGYKHLDNIVFNPDKSRLAWAAIHQAGFLIPILTHSVNAEQWIRETRTEMDTLE